MIKKWRSSDDRGNAFFVMYTLAGQALRSDGWWGGAAHQSRAPEKNIVWLAKKRVLTRRGKDMNPVLGLGGHRLIGTQAIISGWLVQRVFILVGKSKQENIGFIRVTGIDC